MIDITDIKVGDKIRLIKPFCDHEVDFTTNHIGKEYVVTKIIITNNLQIVVINISTKIQDKEIMVDDYGISKLNFDCFEKVSDKEKVPDKPENNQEKCKSDKDIAYKEPNTKEPRVNVKYYTDNMQFNNVLEFCDIRTFTAFGKTTIVAVRFPNNYVIVESSSCADEKDYNEKLGIKLCMQRIEQKYMEHIAFMKCEDHSMWDSLEELDCSYDFLEDIDTNKKENSCDEECSCDCCDCIGKDVCVDSSYNDYLPIDRFIDEMTDKLQKKIYESIKRELFDSGIDIEEDQK